MAELDFVNFGVRLDKELLRRASEALSELHKFGDLELRSVWLYYGSLAAVSEALGGSAHTFLRAVKQNQRHSRLRHRHWRAHYFTEMSEEELDVVKDGSQMILEMPRAERDLLFPPNRRLPLKKEKYIARVESWRKTQSGEWRAGYGFDNPPVPSALELIESYVNCWNFWTQFNRFDETAGRSVHSDFMNWAQYRVL